MTKEEAQKELKELNTQCITLHKQADKLENQAKKLNRAANKHNKQINKIIAEYRKNIGEQILGYGTNVRFTHNDPDDPSKCFVDQEGRISISAFDFNLMETVYSASYRVPRDGDYPWPGYDVKFVHNIRRSEITVIE